VIGATAPTSLSLFVSATIPQKYDGRIRQTGMKRDLVLLEQIYSIPSHRRG